MRISTKGRGIIRAQQGAVARPNPKENYKLPEDQRYQAQTRGMKDFAIEWYKERAKQPKYQSQVNESNLANITDQINRAEYVEPSKFYSNPNVYKGKVGNVTQAAQVAIRQNKGAAYPAGLQYTYNAPSFPFSGRFGDVSWHEGIGHMVGDNNPQILKANPGINNRVDYESSTPLESQVYSSQPNERHADTWGFRGAKHSRLLKQIRVKALSFPSDMFCLNEAAKDADVSPYMKSDEFEVTIGNLREYQE